MKIIRQPLTNRVVHWGIALSCFGLIFSGILQMPVAKRYGLTSLGEWMGNYFTTLSMHYFFRADLCVLLLLPCLLPCIE